MRDVCTSSASCHHLAEVDGVEVLAVPAAKCYIFSMRQQQQPVLLDQVDEGVAAGGGGEGGCGGGRGAGGGLHADGGTQKVADACVGLLGGIGEGLVGGWGVRRGREGGRGGGVGADLAAEVGAAAENAALNI